MLTDFVHCVHASALHAGPAEADMFVEERRTKAIVNLSYTAPLITAPVSLQVMLCNKTKGRLHLRRQWISVK